MIKISQFLNKKMFIYGMVSLGLTILFSFRDLLLIFMGLDFSSIINVPSLIWEENYVYFNWINNTELNSTKYLPFGLHLLSKIIFKFICMGNQTLFYLLVHGIFPVISFWLIYAIYSHYINRTWAMALAFLGIIYLKHFSMLDALKSFITSPLNYIQTGPVALFEISRLLYPSISFLLFIATLYFSLRYKNLTFKAIIICSILWGAHIYIYPINWVAGVCFGGCMFPYIVIFRKYQLKTVINYCFVSFLCLVISLPYLQQ